jgi:integrase/recombinase XerD
VSGKYGSESECQSTEIGLNKGAQNGNVTGDIYNIQNRLENVNKRIESSQRITPRNKELIWKFCEHCRLQGLSDLRVVFYLNRFRNIARLATKNFDEISKEDVQRLVMALRELKKRNGEPICERTIADHLVAIKTFWKWLKGTENEFPPEVNWIKCNSHGTSPKLPEELPNADDVQKLIDAATNARDKALISILYDSGCRISELLTLRIRNVEFDDYGAVLHVNGKTGQRRVRIIHSVLRLQAWLEEHPLRNSPEAPVFCSLSNKN